MPGATGTIPGREASVGALAWMRLALLPVAFAAERLSDHPSARRGLFDLLIAVGVVYAVSVLWAGREDRVPVPGAVLAGTDLALVAGLAYASGGLHSELAPAFLVLPLGAAFVAGPRETAIWSALCLAAMVAVAAAEPGLAQSPEARHAAAQGLFVALAGGGAVLLSGTLARRSQHIQRLAASRGRVAAQAVHSETHERRRLAQLLHDDALQNLLAVRQELDEIEEGDRSGLQRARQAMEPAVALLREAVFSLYPPVLEHMGLEAALEAYADQQALAGGYRARVSVAPDATRIDDQLILGLGQELLRNAATHAGAREVDVRVVLENGSIVLDVEDDGRGFDEGRRAAALREGRVGLASSAERVEALGGTFEVATSPGRGTRVHVTVPVRRERRRVARP